MWLIIVEALAALAILLFLVWWTMFSGRRDGEREPRRDDDTGAGHDPDERDRPAPPR